MIYAVIKTGGKQEKVVPGQRLKVDRIKDAGETVSFTPLLVVRDDGDVVVGDDLGSYAVEAKVLGDERGVKIHGFKYKSKSGYRRRWGHRQELTVLEVTKIGDHVASKEKPADEAKPEANAERKKAAPKAKKKTEAKKTEPKKTEPKAKKTEPKKTEPKAKKTEPKKTAPKKSEPKKSEPKAKKKAEEQGEE